MRAYKRETVHRFWPTWGAPADAAVAASAGYGREAPATSIQGLQYALWTAVGALSHKFLALIAVRAMTTSEALRTSA